MKHLFSPLKKEVPTVALLIDDQPIVGHAIGRMLENEKDIEFHFCANPQKAIALANKIKPTVILQDLIMPEVDGLTMVKHFRANPSTRDVPMIVLSSREEANIKSKAFDFGANDYLVKLPDPLEVIARIRYHSQAYARLLQRNAAFEALQASQTILQAQLEEADRYVQSLLPLPIQTSHLQTHWAFKSSSALGGDAFGYHWIDSDHFALYLLDVCGHGVGAALLSVSAMNVLRSQSLVEVDFKKPVAVLDGLNSTFNMEQHNQMYFTLWYGVYNKNTHEITYASAGHPPAVLFNGPDLKTADPTLLTTKGMVIGGLPDVSFEAKTTQLTMPARLYLFSDGVYEVFYANKSGMMDLSSFVENLTLHARKSTSNVQDMVNFMQKVQGQENFEDDFSLLEVQFNE